MSNTVDSFAVFGDKAAMSNQSAFDSNLLLKYEHKICWMMTLIFFKEQKLSAYVINLTRSHHFELLTVCYRFCQSSSAQPLVLFNNAGWKCEQKI